MRLNLKAELGPKEKPFYYFGHTEDKIARKTRLIFVTKIDATIPK